MSTVDLPTPADGAPLRPIRLWEGRRGRALRLVLLLWVAWGMRTWASADTSLTDRLDSAAYAMGVVTAALLFFRPAWSTAALMAMLLLSIGRDNGDGWQMELFFTWAVVRLSRASARLWWEAAGGTILWLAWLAGTNRWRGQVPEFVASILVMLGALASAVVIQRRRLQQVAGQGDQRRLLQAELAQTRQRERSRLADELQLTLTSRLARMRALLTIPVPDVDARLAVLEQLDDAARAALAELRLVMAVLTDQSTDPAGQAAAELEPSAELLATLDEVNDQLEPLGVTVLAPSGLAGLPPSTQGALVRALREVAVPLLRSTREPRRARAEIQLDQRQVTLTVELADRVAVGSSALDARVRLLGGSISRERFAAGVAPDGSSVRVALPVADHPARVRRGVPWSLVVRILIGLFLLTGLAQGLAQGWATPVTLLALLVLLVNRWWGVPLAVLAGCWTLVSDPWMYGVMLIAALPLYYCRDSARVQRVLWASIGCWLVLAMILQPPASWFPEDLILPLVSWLLALAIRADWLTLERERVLTGRLLARRRRVENEVRSGLARELHDVVAHQLSVVTLQIMGHRHSRDAAELDLVLERVRAATARAETELASLGRVMRTGQQAEAELPSEVLPRLVEELRAAGHRVQVQACDGLDELPQAPRHTLVRFVQEGTTNVLRHARPGSEVRLVCGRRDDALLLELSNPMAEEQSQLAHLSLGKGLQGLSDRVQLLGGRLEAGPTPEGWRLAAEIPVE